MKLVNSKLEDEIRLDLKRDRIELSTFQGDKRILDVLVENAPSFKAGYFLGWTPEQGEDIYIILTDEGLVFKIEVNGVDEIVVPIWDRMSLSEYQSLIKGKSNILKCLIAAQLLDATE